MKIFDDILDNITSANFEHQYFARTEKTELEVIDFIGTEIAKSFLAEFGRFCPPDKKIPVLAAIGTGNNGADALAFLQKLALSRDLNVSIFIGKSTMQKANTKAMLERLQNNANVEILTEINELKKEYSLLVEGIAAMSYRPPMRSGTAMLIERLNDIKADVKVAIDIPIGLSDEDEECPIFIADATYATAIAKQTIFKQKNRKFVGRIRYIDADFFKSQNNKSDKLIIKPNALKPLSKLRCSFSDKRSFGKLLIISGSEKYAGAAMLNAKTAIRSGVGFVYSCVPIDYKPAFCASEPAVIWHACQCDDSGAIALENFTEINALAKQSDSILIGSGLTNSREASALVGEILKANPTLPVVIDADAITQNIVEILPKRQTPAILTPHEGEFLRIAKDTTDKTLLETAKKFNSTIMLKSNITRICDGRSIAYSTRGSPALARAGSGDILCALTASILANKSILEILKSDDDDHLKLLQKVGALSAQWLGIAAERASAESGEIPLSASETIKHLPKALQ